MEGRASAANANSPKTVNAPGMHTTTAMVLLLKTMDGIVSTRMPLMASEASVPNSAVRRVSLESSSKALFFRNLRQEEMRRRLVVGAIVILIIAIVVACVVSGCGKTVEGVCMPFESGKTKEWARSSTAGARAGLTCTSRATPCLLGHR